MLVSKLIKKLEVEKGFRCNQVCATCVCEKTRESVLSQIKVYTELHNQGVIPDDKYEKDLYVLVKESTAIIDCCNRLYEVFEGMIATKVDEYCAINDKWLKFDEMPVEIYDAVFSSIEQSFREQYTGGDRYDKQ